MTDSAAFGLVCEEIERITQLSRLEARGTVRLAMKEAGGDADESRPLRVFLPKAKPAERQKLTRSSPRPSWLLNWDSPGATTFCGRQNCISLSCDSRDVGFCRGCVLSGQ